MAKGYRVLVVPFMVSLRVSGAMPTATIAWDTVVGRTYQVQYKSNLTAAWSNPGAAVTATSLSLSVTDQATDGMRIYRVLRLN